MPSQSPLVTTGTTKEWRTSHYEVVSETAPFGRSSRFHCYMWFNLLVIHYARFHFTLSLRSLVVAWSGCSVKGIRSHLPSAAHGEGNLSAAAVRIIYSFLLSVRFTCHLIRSPHFARITQRKMACVPLLPRHLRFSRRSCKWSQRETKGSIAHASLSPQFAPFCRSLFVWLYNRGFLVILFGNLGNRK